MLDIALTRVRLCLVLTVLVVALSLTATGQAQVQSPDGGMGAAESVVPDIPNGMTAEQAFRFVGGLTDAEARRLVLDRIEERVHQTCATHRSRPRAKLELSCTAPQVPSRG